MDIYRRQFGKKLREARKSADLTQEKLAELVGVEPASISRWETGKDFPENYRLAKICDALGIQPEFFHSPAEQKSKGDSTPEWADRLEDRIQKFIFGVEERMKESVAQSDQEKELLRLFRAIPTETGRKHVLDVASRHVSPSKSSRRGRSRTDAG